MNLNRENGRTAKQLRPISIMYDVYGYADASVLFEQGNTKVLISVSLQQGVPNFLKGQKTGWLSAEYAMLPHATHQRTMRESSQNQRNSRSVEISRLIGRCLRSTIDFSMLGERSIVVDCDVLQADGGTRVACITAASLALKCASQRWLAYGWVDKNVFKEQLVALSTGIVQGSAVVDLDYAEDSSCDADFNFVLSEHGTIVEIQGTSEKKPLDWSLFESLKQLACDGAQELLTLVCNLPTTLPEKPKLQESKRNQSNYQQQERKQAFFSLGNRLNKA